MNIKIIILVVAVGLIIVSCSPLFNKKPYDNSTVVRYYDDHFESPVTDNEEIKKT